MLERTDAAGAPFEEVGVAFVDGVGGGAAAGEEARGGDGEGGAGEEEGAEDGDCLHFAKLML